jgi:hypothetical protein
MVTKFLKSGLLEFFDSHVSYLQLQRLIIQVTKVGITRICGAALVAILATRHAYAEPVDGTWKYASSGDLVVRRA